METEKIFSIRKIDHTSIGQLKVLSNATFRETYEAFNTTENMNTYLVTNFSEEKLVQELNNPACAFFIAYYNERAVGYLKLNSGHAQTEMKNENGVEVERIYVLAEFKGKQIGKLFLQKAIEVAINKQAAFIWLGVWEKNTPALSFYKKNGFVEFDRHIFRLGNDEQLDIMMKKRITPEIVDEPA